MKVGNISYHAERHQSKCCLCYKLINILVSVDQIINLANGQLQGNLRSMLQYNQVLNSNYILGSLVPCRYIVKLADIICVDIDSYFVVQISILGSNLFYPQS